MSNSQLLETPTIDNTTWPDIQLWHSLHVVDGEVTFGLESSPEGR
jgi:hypothetical protein